jgi:hypothetical protein
MGLFGSFDYLPHRSAGGGGVDFDVGVAVPTADLRAVLFVNGAGALDTERDSGALGATGAVLDRFKIAEHIADTVFLGHFDHNASSTDYQIRLDADGDTFIKAPGAGAALTLIGGDSGAGTILFLTNNGSRWSINSSGHFIQTAGVYMELAEMAAPTAPAANRAKFFCQDNGSGKTQVAVIFPTGAVQVIATEP